VYEWKPPKELPDLRNVGLLGLDTETNDEGLRVDHGPGWPWRGGYTVGISVAWREGSAIRSTYIPIRHPDSANFDREQVICWLHDLVASDQEGTRNAYRLEIDLLPMVHRMRRRGIRVDTSAAEQARDLLLQRRDAVLVEISEKLGASVGMAEINGRNWKIATFDRLGIEYPLTELGNPSFKRSKKRGWMRYHSH
jgi:hypothetical protein